MDGATEWIGVQNGQKDQPSPLKDFILQPTGPETFQDPSENRDRGQDSKAENGVEIVVITPNGKGTEQCAAFTISQPGETDI